MKLETSDHVTVRDGAFYSCCGSAMERVRVIGSKGSDWAWSCDTCSRYVKNPAKTSRVSGGFLAELLDPMTGRVLESRTDNNVFTDSGRNYLASLISYAAFQSAPGSNEPASSKRRYDGVRYMALGVGSQLETNTVSRLHTPIPFNSNGDYLAQVIAPNELPASGVSAVFRRVFGLNEISVSGPVSVTEAGLYVSGPESAPTLVSSGNAPPIAYKVFEPLTKTTNVLLAVTWEIRF